jgi:LysM repeat protein
MQKLSIRFLFFFLVTTVTASAQQSEAVTNYIYTYKQLAIEEMKRTGVPAAITLAQGIHESGAGKSKLATSSNNHFGIKCKSTWTGEKVYHDDDARGECFRKYSAVLDSYKDHSDFLKNGQRYAFLFQLDPEDYAGWANGLKKAGYATNPKYPQVLIKLVEDYGLQHYTMIGVGKIPDQFNPADTMLGVRYQGDAEMVQIGNEVGQKEHGVLVPDEKQETKPTNNTTPGVSYPAGVFKINDTKVVYVMKGTSFFAIAKQYDVDLSKIFEFNDIPRVEFTEKNQLVYLQRKRKTGNEAFHIVQPGETLHDISQLQAIRLESLRELNWLGKNEVPAPGVSLSLKTKSASMPKLALKQNHSLTTTNN